MSNDDSGRRLSRRKILTLTTGGIAALAGCGSSSQGSDSENTSKSKETTEPAGSGTNTDAQQSQGEQSSDTRVSGSGSLPGWISDPADDKYDSDETGPGMAGQTLWQKATNPGEMLNGKATIVDGHTYIASQSSVKAFDTDGDSKWSKQLKLDLDLDGDVTPFLMGDTLVVVATSPSRIIGLKSEDGERRYLDSGPSQFSQVRPIGTQEGSLLYLVKEEDDEGVGHRAFVVWYDPAEGSVVQKSNSFEGRYTDQDVLIGDGRVYFSGIAVSLFDGNKVWETPHKRYSTSLLYSNGIVIRAKMGSGNVYERFYALDAETGERLWDKNAAPNGNYLWGAAADGSRLFAHSEKKVIAYNLENGEKEWQQITASALKSQTVVGGTNVYVGTADDQIHVLNAENGKRRSRFNVAAVPKKMSVVGNRLYCYSGILSGRGNSFSGSLHIIGPKENN